MTFARQYEEIDRTLELLASPPLKELAKTDRPIADLLPKIADETKQRRELLDGARKSHKHNLEQMRVELTRLETLFA